MYKFIILNFTQDDQVEILYNSITICALMFDVYSGNSYKAFQYRIIND